jgi:hypothetical protein
VASGQDGPRSVAVDDTAIYWTNSVPGGSVMKCALPSCEGGPTELATGQGRPYAIAVVQGQVVWTNLDSGEVRSCPKDGGPAADIEIGANAPSSLFPIGSGVWFNERDDDSIKHCELPPSPSDCFFVMNVGDETGADWVNVADGRLLWIRDGAEIRQCSTNADCNEEVNRTTLVGGLTQASSLSVDDAQLYWLEASSVRSAPRTGMGAAATIADGQSDPAFLALDAADVYWTNTLDGTVRKAPKKGGASPTTVASGQKGPAGIVVYGPKVYWANAGDGTIRSAAK